jgi:lipoprotein NlpI
MGKTFIYIFSIILSILIFSSCQRKPEDLKLSGDNKHGSGDYLGAIQDYNQAIEINPKYDVAYHARGKAKLKVGDYNGAIEDFTKLLKINPGYYDAYGDCGRAKDELGDYAGALEDYSKIIQLKPEDYYYNKRAMDRYRISDYKGAIDDYCMFPASSFNAEIYLRLGAAMNKLPDYQAAIKIFNKLLEVSPKFADGYYQRGYAKYMLQDYKGNYEDWKYASYLGSSDADESIKIVLHRK